MYRDYCRLMSKISIVKPRVRKNRLRKRIKVLSNMATAGALPRTDFQSCHLVVRKVEIESNGLSWAHWGHMSIYQNPQELPVAKKLQFHCLGSLKFHVHNLAKAAMAWQK